jgi:phosphoribosylformylglycinamidine synthase subunit PurQ / glutaminase
MNAPRISPTGKARVAVLQFPGSNCDVDCLDTLSRHFDIKAQPVWHTEANLPAIDGIVIPGGFSFGDYLRSGALATHSPVMAAVRDFAAKGGAVIGICNGFQILTESRLLPGALLRNASRQFICAWTELGVEKGQSVYHQRLSSKILRVPIAHGEGRYFASPETLRQLEGEGQVVFRYVDATGKASDAANPNGAVGNIAGIVSANGRVLGLMPHPERATDKLMGESTDGLGIWQAFLATFA